MPPNIQNISPSYAICSLLPKPCGTFIVRYPTENDDVISSISLRDHSNQDPPTSLYVILSIRVDETIYKEYIKHYRLPYTEHNMQEDLKKILETYNHQQSKLKNGKFTSLEEEFTPPTDDGSWLLDEKCFVGIDFNKIQNAGQHSNGISMASWQCNRQNDIKIFIKRFKKVDSYFTDEFSLLKDLCHPTIISFYGQYSDNTYNYLVFENGGESLQSICPLQIEPLRRKLRFITNVGFQVAYAMMYLEQKKIVHRDLTAGNVLINSYGFIRVADFGHAIKKKEDINTLEQSGTDQEEKNFLHRFLAPECFGVTKKVVASDRPTIQNKEDVCMRFTSKSDIWSFGILIIQLMLKDPRKPYPDVTIGDIPAHIKQERKIHPKPDECPDDMYSLLQGCWVYEANKRISFADARYTMFRLEAIFR